MLLKLTLSDTDEPVYVHTNKIIAFRESDKDTIIVTTHNELRIRVKESPEQIATMWGSTVKQVSNEGN